MTIGDRIKRVRNFRSITQKAFGLALGFGEKSADVRIAQYESNKRTPKEAILRKMAEILDVNFGSLNEPTLNTDENIIYSLFELDEHYQLSLHEITDDDSSLFSIKTVAISFNSNKLDSYMFEWFQKKNELKERIITKKEYTNWKLNWPEKVEINK